MRLRRAGVALFGALFLTTNPTPSFAGQATAPAQEAEAVFERKPDGSLVHLASGFSFPPRLASLPFVGEHVFEPDNVSARYGSGGPEDGTPWLDFYVYPAEGRLEEEAAEVGQIIVERYKATPVPSPRALPQTAGEGRMQWYSASLDGADITTAYILFRRDGWSVKLRATSPAAAGSAGIEQLLDAIDAVDWSWAPAHQPAQDTVVVASR